MDDDADANCQDDPNDSASRELEETTRASTHHLRPELRAYNLTLN